MKKQYYYAIDDFSRFTEIYEVTEENKESLSYYLLGEFEESKIKEVQLNVHGLVDGKIIRIGKVQEEIEKDNINNLYAELEEIRQWLTDNDWIPNKIITGEWETSDARWIEYLFERSNKRARQDELNELLNT